MLTYTTWWGEYWPDAVRYLGSQPPDDATSLHLLGFSREAAECLASTRNIDGAGIGTTSIDYRKSKGAIVNQIFSGAGIYALE